MDCRGMWVRRQRLARTHATRMVCIRSHTRQNHAAMFFVLPPKHASYTQYRCANSKAHTLGKVKAAVKLIIVPVLGYGFAVRLAAHQDKST